MAYPVPEDSATTSQTSGTSLAMNIPAGVSAKDTLLAFVSNWDTTDNQIVFPSDWVEVFTEYTNDLAVSIYAYYADGTESGTIAITVNNDSAASIVYRLSGAANPNFTPPVAVGGGGQGGSIVPGGTQFSASSFNTLGIVGGPWGKYDRYLCLVSYHYNEAMNGVLSYPDNYSNFINVDTGAGGSTPVGVTVGHRDIQSLGEFFGRWRMYDNNLQRRINTGVIVFPAESYVPPSTFPYINKTALSTDAQRVTSTEFELILPPLEPGDIIIGVVATYNALVDTYTWPADWTLLYDISETSSNDLASSCAWKKADGSEGRTVTVGVDPNPCCGVAFSVNNIPDPDITMFEWDTDSGNSQGHGAGSITPAAGSDNYLWVGVYATESDNAEYYGFPTNYNGRFVVKGDWSVNSQDVTIAVCHTNDEVARTSATSESLLGGSTLADVCAQFVFYPGSFDPGNWWYLGRYPSGRGGTM